MVAVEKPNVERLLFELRELARKGPLPAVAQGDSAVGLTLLHALGLRNTSTRKAYVHGIAISAKRRATGTIANRVNLFSQVPDWKLSVCKSSQEIAERYGYNDEGEKGRRRLYCTVSAKRANAQGLLLEVDRSQGLLFEIQRAEGKDEKVACWPLPLLLRRLVENHPASIWVTAAAQTRGGREFFHFRECLYVGPPRAEVLPDLLEVGTVTLDHLIEIRSGRVSEKGPLFKIKPQNISLLFPDPRRIDLLERCSFV